MEGGNGSRMWKTLKQRLGIKRMGCCGAATWTPPPRTILTIITEPSSPEMTDDPDGGRGRDRHAAAMHPSDVPAARDDEERALLQAPALSGMNLAAALEAERNLGRGRGPGPVKTLMRLIEETDGVDLKQGRRRDKGAVRKRNGGGGGGGGGGAGCEWVCCVCMERSKGAAFIPCGHTFCRVCSRELWVNRGCCPICNRSILEILDLF